jgi:hypothetical protein
VKSALEGIAKFFGWLKQITEQLTQPERRALILSDALRNFLRGRKLQPPCCRLETLAWIEILSSSQELAGVNAVFGIKVTPGGPTFRRLKNTAWRLDVIRDIPPANRMSFSDGRVYSMVDVDRRGGLREPVRAGERPEG